MRLLWRTLVLLGVTATIVAGVGTEAAAPGHRVLAVARPVEPDADLALPAELPGLGPHTLASVPTDSSQVVEVVGAGVNSPDATVVLYERTPDGWLAGPSWPAHNALHGWSANHRNGDLRSPDGVFALTDAGGLLADPGTKLTYDHSRGFRESGTGFTGESLAGAFNYVVAINYNRKAGTSPLDWTMPLGAARGHGIWFHVDHGGPTHGCVSLATADMLTLLHTLDPAKHPVVVMGDSAWLAH